MNKYDFLRKLDKELSPLDLAERKELLAFYEERFYTGTIYENKTEEQVIAELESPEQIARNILAEYGISSHNRSRRQEQVPVSETPRRENERPQKDINKTDNTINIGALIGLICVDLFVLSWAIPTLYSVVIAMVPALISYFGVFGFLAGGTTTLEVATFWVFTGVYYLLFLATLGLIELTIWTTKKAVLYHLRVFGYKKYKDVNKRLSSISLENWFKKHKFIRFLKNLAGLAAVIVIVLGGTFVFNNYDEIYQTYVGDEMLEQVDTFDPADYAFDDFNIEVSSEDVAIELVETSGDNIVVSRTYVEVEGEIYTVQMVDNTLSIVRDIPTQINFLLSFDDLAQWFINDKIIIEIPSSMDIDDIKIVNSNGSIDVIGRDASTIYLESSNGSIDVKGINTDALSADTSNGGVEFIGVTVTGISFIDTNNGSITILDSELYTVDFTTSNGKITVKDTTFVNALLSTSNGKVILNNVTSYDDPSLDEFLTATSSNGKLQLEEVYVPVITLSTSNADIEFNNEDTTFDIDLEHSTSNGEYEGNVN